jgi:hypothetical protein
MSLDLRPSNRAAYALLVVLMAMSIGVQAARDARWSTFEPPTPTLWLQSGGLAHRLALGFDSLAADAYWIRAVVYYGGRAHASRDDREGRPQTNFNLL